MFSSTTIASSTTKPVAIVSAISERLSRLKPSRYIVPKVPMIEIGTAMAGISVARQSRRNRNTTAVTSSTAITSVRSVSFSEARMVVERSAASVISTSGGSAAWRCGSTAFTVVDGVDDVGAGLAEQDHQHRCLAVVEPRVAQILDRIDHLADIGQPHAVAVAIGHHQRHVVRRQAGLIVGVDLITVVPCSIAPFGLLALAEASAARTSSSPMPYLNSAVGLSSTRTAGQRRTAEITWPMPLSCESCCSSTLLAAS